MENIRLLASLDERHNTLSGPATKKLCERAHQLFNQTQYQRLAGISVAYLYNLRKSQSYLRQRYTFEKTRPKVALIGERKKSIANGEPGFIRIDTVHQGDQDKQKGVYHINGCRPGCAMRAGIATMSITPVVIVTAPIARLVPRRSGPGGA